MALILVAHRVCVSVCVFVQRMVSVSVWRCAGGWVGGRCCVGALPYFFSAPRDLFAAAFCVLVLSEAVCSPIYSMVDSGVMSMLGKDHQHLYGKQR